MLAVFNNEDFIEEVIEHCLSQGLELVILDDGSTDGTDKIVKDFAVKNKKIKLLRVEGRVGKTETQNQAILAANGEIIIFSDATTDYKTNAIRKIVRNYADPSVGAVSGRYNYVNEKGSAMGVATILFWDYENFIKSCQTQIKTIRSNQNL